MNSDDQRSALMLVAIKVIAQMGTLLVLIVGGSVGIGLLLGGVYAMMASGLDLRWQAGTLTATTETPVADAYIVAVPTPFTETHAADLTYIEAAAADFDLQISSGYALGRNCERCPHKQVAAQRIGAFLGGGRGLEDAEVMRVAVMLEDLVSVKVVHVAF
mgnify:CR=1 FL=1